MLERAVVVQAARQAVDVARDQVALGGMQRPAGRTGALQHVEVVRALHLATRREGTLQHLRQLGQSKRDRWIEIATGRARIQQRIQRGRGSARQADARFGRAAVVRHRRRRPIRRAESLGGQQAGLLHFAGGIDPVPARGRMPGRGESMPMLVAEAFVERARHRPRLGAADQQPGLQQAPHAGCAVPRTQRGGRAPVAWTQFAQQRHVFGIHVDRFGQLRRMRLPLDPAHHAGAAGEQAGQFDMGHLARFQPQHRASPDSHCPPFPHARDACRRPCARVASRVFFFLNLHQGDARWP